MISRAVSCKGALENFSKTTNCTRYLLRLVKYLVFDKITRFFVVFVVVVVVFFLKLCQYYFVLLPTGCSVSFEAKSSFPYSFETSCKTCESSAPLFNENLCFKNTSKTYHEDFTRKRYFELS